MSDYPDTPITREEQYLAAGLDGGDLPDPITREEQYLYEIATKMQSGGSSVTVEPLTVTQNGTTTAPSGTAYSPVTVNVPASAPVLETLTVTANGTYTPEEGVDGFDEVEVNVRSIALQIADRSVTNINAGDLAGITTIGKYAFGYCEELETVVIPDSVASIRDSAFYGCIKLVSINIPNSVTTIGSAFAHCETLQSIALPSGITDIPGATFRWCYYLHNVTLPVNLSTVGNYAFAQCRQLESITFPASVTKIGTGCFNDCSQLQNVHMEGTTPPVIQSDTFSTGHSVIIYVPRSEDQSVLNAYKAATNWARYANDIQEEPV